MAVVSPLEVPGLTGELPSTRDVTTGSAWRDYVRGLPSRLGVGGMIALGWLVVILVLVTIAPLLPLDNPQHTYNFNPFGTLPSRAHWLGTDELGRDEFSRLIYGGRGALLVGFCATLFGTVAGMFFGTVAGMFFGIAAGYHRARVDRLLLILFDSMVAIPGLILTVDLVSVFGSSNLALICIVAITFIPASARVARIVTMSLMEEDYMLAARSLGVRPWRLVSIEVIPRVMGTLSTYALVLVGVGILVQGTLSYLGVAVGDPNWGGMIAQGQGDIGITPELCLYPAALTCATIISLNLLSDRLRANTGSRLD